MRASLFVCRRLCCSVDRLRRFSVFRGFLVAGIEQRQDHPACQQPQGDAKREQGGNLDQVVQEILPPIYISTSARAYFR